MPDPNSRRSEAYPHFTSRRHWKSYALGMLTETAFILGLTLIGFALAVIGLVIFR